MDYQTSQKILAGNASDKEKEAFYKELEENEETKKEFIRLKELWDLYHLGQHKLSAKRKKQLFQEFRLTIQGKNKKITVPLRFLNVTKYAAIVLLALLLGFYLHGIKSQTTSAMRELHSENGSISSVVLNDGSKIWLNSNTTLKIWEEKKKGNSKTFR
ncbi:MAG: hypothetical protein AB2L24_23265 [Mangrovibacterium sp.]